MIDLAKLRAELQQLRSLRAQINAAVGRNRPSPEQWKTLGELARREQEIGGIIREECIVL